MNCVDWEERIALYAGGDLAPAEAEAVQRHVAECSGCQVLLSGLRESLELIREAHSEPIDQAHFAAVRARVLSELERGNARRWRWAWIPAFAAAAMVIVAVANWPRPELRMAIPMPHAPAAPAVARVVRPAAQPAPVQPRKLAAPETSASLVVKIETDNPDVVIYWIADTKGETK